MLKIEYLSPFEKHSSDDYSIYHFPKGCIYKIYLCDAREKDRITPKTVATGATPVCRYQ